MPTPPAGPQVQTGPRTYLVAQDDAVAPLDAGPLDFGWVVEQLHADDDVEVERELTPRSLVLQELGSSVGRTVVVAAMSPQKAAELAAHPQIVLEEDLPLHPAPLPAPAPPRGLVGDPSLVVPFGVDTQWRLALRTPAGDPVVDATVLLYGSGVPAQGRSDAQGEVTLTLTNEHDPAPRALYVNPRRDVWSLWVDEPVLVPGEVTTVTLRPLSSSMPGFPDEQVLGWGQRAMRLDALPPGLDGHGVRVAVVDSGSASLTHPDLAAARVGVDLTTTPASSTGWTDDTVAHGSHCGGIVAGADDGHGIRGFAPAAEVHNARIFPGGRVSSLVDAVDYCIDQQVDVVNMSLGSGGTSQIMLQKLNAAREQGVACIVAAGNSAGPVQFPGTSPDVLTVSAIGRTGQFPDDSYHARQVLAGGVTTPEGYFAAAFSCHGPEVDVCGPGVAVVSSVPDSGFAAWDGTSMATPHVAGLAALVLAHHPDFREPGLRVRTAARVDRLFELLRSSATPLALGDPDRTGAGLPDAPRALGLEGAAPERSGARTTQEADASAVVTALAQVRAHLVAAGLLATDGPTVAVASVDAPGAAPDRSGTTTAAERELARDLVAVRARLTSCGLVVPG